MQPLISVIIPAYNSEKHIAAALSSVYDQTWENLECIVVDDGSSDATAEIVTRFGQGVRYEFQQNAGVSAARNHGIKLAKGDYIAFLDSDDLWATHKLESQINILLEDPEIGLISTEYHILSEDDYLQSPELSSIGQGSSRIDIHSDFSHLFEKPYLCTSTVMLPTAIAREVGGFDRDLPTADVELVASPDRRLKEADAVVATADSAILDRCSRWLNLARRVIDEAVPDAWLVDLSGT